jgi:hypothetical protein
LELELDTWTLVQGSWGGTGAGIILGEPMWAWFRGNRCGHGHSTGYLTPSKNTFR